MFIPNSPKPPSGMALSLAFRDEILVLLNRSHAIFRLDSVAAGLVMAGQPTAINYLYFQQHSRVMRLSAFVFIDIPASPAGFPQRSFVFIEIPGSFVQF
jgi:hypothetical protein